MNINTVKIILAVLFFICLLDMPYGYYQLVRFVGFIGFLYLAVDSFQMNKESIAVGWVDLRSKHLNTLRYSVLAILFQPFFKIALGREIWNIVDVVVGIGLLISIFMKTKENTR